MVLYLYFMINPCLICNISFNNKRTFNSHLFNKHQLNPKEYYDKFIKKEFEGFCGFCNKQTGFRNTTYGYKKMCSRKCYDLLLLTDERKHNVSILTKKAMQRDDVKENIKKHHSKGVSDETRKKMSILAKRKLKRLPTNTQIQCYPITKNFMGIRLVLLSELKSSPKCRLSQLWPLRCGMEISNPRLLESECRKLLSPLPDHLGALPASL